MSNTPARLSADGLFYWDGKQWVSALSADGRSRWDGTSWVQIPPTYSPHPTFISPPPAQTVGAPRVPTNWTRPLQTAVSAMAAAYLLWYAALPFWATKPMSDEIRRRALVTAAHNPALYPDPTGYASSVATFGLVLTAVTSLTVVAIATVVLIGAIRRWMWMHYAVLALLALSILGLPGGLAAALGIVQPAPALGGSLVVVQWSGVVLGAFAIALGSWMLVALLRRGPWAMRKVSAGE